MKDRIAKAKTWIKAHRNVLTLAGVGTALAGATVLLVKENNSKAERYPFSAGELPKPTLEDYEAELAEIEEMRAYVQADIDALKQA